MRTTTYRAPDKHRGYTGGEIAAILSRHDPEATLVVRVGWKGQPQQLVVTECDRPLVERSPHLAEREDLVTRCETPPPGNIEARLQGSLDATDDEEWLREQLRERGVPVHVVEAVARRGMYMDHELGRAELAAHGIDLAVIDEVAHKYRELVRRRDSARKLDGGTR